MTEGQTPNAEVDLSDVLDLVDLLINSTNDVADAKEADGTIGIQDSIKIAMKEASAVIQAIKGITNVPIEIAHLNDAELKILADRLMLLVTALIRLFGLDKK